MFRYFIKNINDLEHDCFEKLDSLTKACFPNSLSLSDMKHKYSTIPLLVFYIKHNKEYIYFTLLYDKRPTLYIYYICVPIQYRGKGILKRAIKYLKTVYSKKSYTSFALDASEEQESQMDQKTRIQIFSKMGFYISHLKNESPFEKHKDPKTYVVTSSGKGLLTEKKGNQYYVLINGVNAPFLIGQIDGCLSDMFSDEPDICPMKMDLLRRNSTRKNVKNGPGGD